MQAAKFVFERKGFLNARVSDIANRAKISHGTFYHYFDSKEAIFLELARREEARRRLHPSGGRRRTACLSSRRRQSLRGSRRYLERYREQAAIMAGLGSSASCVPTRCGSRAGADHHEPEVPS